MTAPSTFEAGYNGIKWARRLDPHDRFYLNAKVERAVGSVRDECVRAAREIADHYHDEEIVVLYSGGRDSDFVLESFRLAGSNVRAVMVRASNGMNDAELLHASEFEVRTGFDKFDIVECDHLKYILTDEYRDMMAAVQCPHSSFLWYWKPILDSYRGRVLVGGSMEPSFGMTKGVWCLTMPEFEYSVYKMFWEFSLQGAPSFFCWSGELWNSFFLTEQFQSLLHNKLGIRVPQHTNMIKGEVLESEFGHRSRMKDVWHTRPEFWNDNESRCVDVFCQRLPTWLKDRGL